MSAISFKKSTPFLIVPKYENEKGLPSKARMTANFLRSQARSIASQVRGNARTVTPETRDARRAICQSNVCGYFRASDGRCAHPRCGCPINKGRIIESKTELYSEFCPDRPSKWGPGELLQTLAQ